MAIQNYSTTLRLDPTTNMILTELITDMNFNKSQVIRRSVRLLKELTDIRKQYGEICLSTAKDKSIVILLG